MTFSNKRVVSIFVLVMSIIGLGFWYCYSVDNILPIYVQTGQWLYGGIIFLILLNIRKKLPFLPLGKVSTWLRIHIYVAYFLIAVFFVHTSFRLPNGLFETFLYLLFIFVNLSGILGLYLSRVAPGKMTDAGGSMVFEAIPQFVKNIKDEADQLALDSINISGQSTLSDFYLTRLSPWFSSPRYSWGLLLNSRRDMNNIRGHINGVSRYLNEKEIEVLHQLRKLAVEKLQLDIHYTFLIVLKYWLFVHIPLSYILLMAGAYHGLLASGFVG